MAAGVKEGRRACQQAAGGRYAPARSLSRRGPTLSAFCPSYHVLSLVLAFPIQLFGFASELREVCSGTSQKEPLSAPRTQPTVSHGSKGKRRLSVLKLCRVVRVTKVLSPAPQPYLCMHTCAQRGVPRSCMPPGAPTSSPLSAGM